MNPSAMGGGSPSPRHSRPSASTPSEWRIPLSPTTSSAPHIPYVARWIKNTASAVHLPLPVHDGDRNTAGSGDSTSSEAREIPLPPSNYDGSMYQSTATWNKSSVYSRVRSFCGRAPSTCTSIPSCCGRAPSANASIPSCCGQSPSVYASTTRFPLATQNAMNLGGFTDNVPMAQEANLEREKSLELLSWLIWLQGILQNMRAALVPARSTQDTRRAQQLEWLIQKTKLMKHDVKEMQQMEGRFKNDVLLEWLNNMLRVLKGDLAEARGRLRAVRAEMGRGEGDPTEQLRLEVDLKVEIKNRESLLAAFERRKQCVKKEKGVNRLAKMLGWV